MDSHEVFHNNDKKKERTSTHDDGECVLQNKNIHF